MILLLHEQPVPVDELSSGSTKSYFSKLLSSELQPLFIGWSSHLHHPVNPECSISCPD